MNIDLAANIIGMIGTVLIVGAYFLMQLNKMDPKGLVFNVSNFIGAVFLTLSLLVHFNLAAIVIEIFWIAASLVGIFNYWRLKSG